MPSTRLKENIKTRPCCLRLVFDNTSLVGAMAKRLGKKEIAVKLAAHECGLVHLPHLVEHGGSVLAVLALALSAIDAAATPHFHGFHTKLIPCCRPGSNDRHFGVV
jgi:hypothetical protein